MKPPARGKPGAKAAPKPHPAATGCEVGDHVYARGPRGPAAYRVLAKGADGFIGHDGEARARIRWPEYLGHKARMLQSYRVVDQGADGALLEDGRGERRFLAGAMPAEPEAPAGPPPASQDDPLLGGLDRLSLSKAATMLIPDGARVLFLKARPAPPGPKEKPAPRPAVPAKLPAKPAPGADGQDGGDGGDPTMRHGDDVAFRHGDVEGRGRIVASGQHGVTVQDEAGREHQVRHEALTGPAAPAAPERPSVGDVVDLEDDSWAPGGPAEGAEVTKVQGDVVWLDVDGDEVLIDWSKAGRAAAVVEADGDSAAESGGTHWRLGPAGEGEDGGGDGRGGEAEARRPAAPPAKGGAPMRKALLLLRRG